MSVDTTADKKIREAKEHLSDAYKCLLEVLDEDCWGHNEFKEGYIDQVQEVAFKILKQKLRL
jgi:hypothetical protein